MWNLTGGVVYNFSQWLLLVVLARMGDPELVGRFTLVLAISAPIFLMTGLNLRTLQVTDARRTYRLEEFFALRTILGMVGAAATLLVSVVVSLDTELLVALAAMCLAKYIEGLNVSCYGYMAIRHRFDLSSQSSIIRGVAGPVCFALGLAVTGELWGAILGLAGAWLMVQFLWDMRWTRRLAVEEGRPLKSMSTARRGALVQMAKRALPLGVDQGVSSYTVNVPRYSVQNAFGSGLLGVYAAQAYLAQIITMVTMSMMGVLVPRLSRAYADGRRRAFVRDLLRLAIVGMALCLVAVVAALLVGDVVIGAVLGEEYVDRALLVTLMVSAGAITLQRVLSKGLEASHQFGRYLMVDVITLGTVAVAVGPLVSVLGIVGAAAATTIGYGVGALVMAGFLVRIVGRMPASP